MKGRQTDKRLTIQSIKHYIIIKNFTDVLINLEI